MVTPNTETVIKTLNSLLRGEISAAETYKMAIDKIAKSDKPAPSAQVQILRDMQEEHGRAAQTLRDRIRALGGKAADSSGAWGTWAETVQGTMNLFGDTAALKSLKEGEEHGIKEYREALEKDRLDPASAQLVRDVLLPTDSRHVNRLDELMHAVR